MAASVYSSADTTIEILSVTLILAIGSPSAVGIKHLHEKENMTPS